MRECRARRWSEEKMERGGGARSDGVERRWSEEVRGGGGAGRTNQPISTFVVRGHIVETTGELTRKVRQPFFSRFQQEK